MLTQGMSSCGQASCLRAASSPLVGKTGIHPDNGLGEVGPVETGGGPGLGASSAADWLDGLGQITCLLRASISSSAKSRGIPVNDSQTLNNEWYPLFSMQNLW